MKSIKFNTEKAAEIYNAVVQERKERKEIVKKYNIPAKIYQILSEFGIYEDREFKEVTRKDIFICTGYNGEVSLYYKNELVYKGVNQNHSNTKIYYCRTKNILAWEPRIHSIFKLAEKYQKYFEIAKELEDLKVSVDYFNEQENTRLKNVK